MFRGTRVYLVDVKHFTTVHWKTEEGKEIPLIYCTYRYHDHLAIGTYSQKQAQHDRYERERQLKKAEQMLLHPEEIHRKA